MPAPMSQGPEGIYGFDQLGDSADPGHKWNCAISSKSSIRWGWVDGCNRSTAREFGSSSRLLCIVASSQ